MLYLQNVLQQALPWLGENHPEVANNYNLKLDADLVALSYADVGRSFRAQEIELFRVFASEGIKCL